MPKITSETLKWCLCYIVCACVGEITDVLTPVSKNKPIIWKQNKTKHSELKSEK